MLAPRSKKPSSSSEFPAMAVQRLDVFRADPRSALPFDDRFGYPPRLGTPRDELDIRYSPYHVQGSKCASFAAPRVPMAPLPPVVHRALPLSPIRPQMELGGSRAPRDASATGIQSDVDRSLSSRHRPDPESPPLRTSRAFFDVVLSAPAAALAHAPAADAPPDTHPRSKPPTLASTNRATMKRKSHKRRRPTPDESSSEDESSYEPSDDSSDEDEPAPSRGLVQITAQGCSEPAIRTSDVRGTTPDTSCEETRRLFDIEYSTHKKPQRRSSRPRSPRPRPQVEAVRKSSRLATRPATPVDIDSATDVSVISSRSVSVVSVRNPPTRRPRPKAKAKPAPRVSSSSNSSRDQSTPQPTSMAYPPDDPPPPAPTHVVSLRPGYNAYTAQDKQWFLDFVAWVFRQNVHAGKAEICQDIFQQAPHHRLESWKSYWRDHISQVEVLRNQARDRLEKQTPPLGKGSAYRSRDKHSHARPSPSTSIESTEPKVEIKRSSEEANKSSEGLWKLAELAELQRTSAPNKPVSTSSLKRRAQETSSELARTKRSKC